MADPKYPPSWLRVLPWIYERGLVRTLIDTVRRQAMSDGEIAGKQHRSVRERAAALGTANGQKVLDRATRDYETYLSGIDDLHSRLTAFARDKRTGVATVLQEQARASDRAQVFGGKMNDAHKALEALASQATDGPGNRAVSAATPRPRTPTHDGTGQSPTSAVGQDATRPVPRRDGAPGRRSGQAPRV